MRKQTNRNQQRRSRRVRTKLRRLSALLRLSVFRSNKHVSGQIIDDAKGKTIAAVSEAELDKVTAGKTKTERARVAGELLAKKARKAKVKVVKFDRGRYRYHGRVKAFAEGARAGGLEL